MTISIRHRCDDFTSYRAARVKSLFNVESGANFSLDAEIDTSGDWKIGVVVGPSGSGKTSIGREVFGEERWYAPDWPMDAPIVDAIAPGGDFDAVTGALAAVGLGDVPAWLRPFAVLSNGEKFRATMARLIADAPAEVVVDEFTSVVDRQIARFGALAFQKAWRRTNGHAVLLTPHYDVLEWLEPDWVYDTATGVFDRRSLHRPRIEMEIVETDWRYWPMFEPHHYLKLPRMVAARNYVGVVAGQPVCHVAVAPRFMGTHPEYRASRLVVLPEWQGAGVGLRFLNEVARLHAAGQTKYARRLGTIIHTSHPGLRASLARSAVWRLVSRQRNGGLRSASARSKDRALVNHGQRSMGGKAGYGGHLRGVTGFRYVGGA